MVQGAPEHSSHSNEVKSSRGELGLNTKWGFAHSDAHWTAQWPPKGRGVSPIAQVISNWPGQKLSKKHGGEPGSPCGGKSR